MISEVEAQKKRPIMLNKLSSPTKPAAATAVTLYSSDYRGKAHLYSILGQELNTIEITAAETTIDISALANGTYFIRLDNQAVSKFVKL